MNSKQVRIALADRKSVRRRLIEVRRAVRTVRQEVLRLLEYPNSSQLRRDIELLDDNLHSEDIECRRHSRSIRWKGDENAVDRACDYLCMDLILGVGNLANPFRLSTKIESAEGVYRSVLGSRDSDRSPGGWYHKHVTDGLHAFIVSLERSLDRKDLYVLVLKPLGYHSEYSSPQDCIAKMGSIIDSAFKKASGRLARRAPPWVVYFDSLEAVVDCVLRAQEEASELGTRQRLPNIGFGACLDVFSDVVEEDGELKGDCHDVEVLRLHVLAVELKDPELVYSGRVNSRVMECSPNSIIDRVFRRRDPWPTASGWFHLPLRNAPHQNGGIVASHAAVKQSLQRDLLQVAEAVDAKFESEISELTEWIDGISIIDSVAEEGAAEQREERDKLWHDRAALLQEIANLRDRTRGGNTLHELEEVRRAIDDLRTRWHHIRTPTIPIDKGTPMASE